MDFLQKSEFQDLFIPMLLTQDCLKVCQPRLKGASCNIKISGRIFTFKMANKWYKHVKIKNIFIIAFTHYIVIMVFESPVGRKEATMHQCSYNGMHWLIYLLGRQRCGNLQSALFLNRHKKSIFCIYSLHVCGDGLWWWGGGKATA